MKNIFNILVSTALLGFVFLYSCKNEVEPTTAEIRVVNADGEPVPFADIILTCTSSVNLPCEIEIIAQADEGGIYKRDFDLPKVLSVISAGNLYDTIITGVLPDTTMTFIKDTICGETFISIKPEQVSVQTIILYDCN
jgi:hypothetical protein